MEATFKRMRLAIAVLDAISEWTARLFAWLVIPLMGVMVYEITVRYLLRPTLWAYDISYMLYGSLFMLGAAYTLSQGGHIRADFIYRNWSPRVQGAVDALFYLLCFFPGLALFLWAGLDFARASWAQEERMMASAWMPAIYPFKTVISVTAGLLLVQGLSEFLKSLHAVLRGEWP